MPWSFNSDNNAGTNMGINGSTMITQPGVKAWGNSPGVQAGSYTGTGMGPVPFNGLQINPTNWKGQPNYGAGAPGWRSMWNGDAYSLLGAQGKQNIANMRKAYMEQQKALQPPPVQTPYTGKDDGQQNQGMQGGWLENTQNQGMQGGWLENTPEGMKARDNSLYQAYAAQGRPWMIPYEFQTPEQRQQSMQYWGSQMAQAANTTGMGIGTNAYNLMKSYYDMYQNGGKYTPPTQNWDPVHPSPSPVTGGSGVGYGGVSGVGGR